MTADPLQIARNHPSRVAPGLWIRMSVLVLIVGSYLATVIVNIRDERQLIQNDLRRVSSITTISAQRHTDTIFQATVQTLAGLRSDLAAASDARSAQQIIDDHYFAPAYLRGILLLDKDGVVVASNFREIIGNTGPEFPFFYLHRDGLIDGPFTGDIIIGKLTRAPHFFTSIALHDENGDFAGVIAAAYELTYLRDLYMQLVPGEHYTIALFHVAEGLIVASDSEIRSGELPKSSQFPADMPSDGGDAPGTLTILLEGGHTAFTNNKAVGTGPFFVSTMADVERLLAKHGRDNFAKHALAALFVVTVIGLAILLEIYIINRRRAEADKFLLEAELRQSQKMEALGTLAGGVAHDFNNLLCAIIGFGELARERLFDNPRVAGSIDQILLAGRRAEAIVNRILAFSRRAETERKTFRLDGIVQEVFELMQVSIPPSIDIAVSINDPQPWVFGDSSQLNQVLMNLCTNSVQAMPEGGRISIRIERAVVDAANARAAARFRDGSYIKLTISDTGQGMDPAIVDRVFEPFFTTKEHGKGSGLGLSIAHSIIAAHEGAITINSSPGIGTEIELWLPAASPNLEADGEDAPMALDGAGMVAMFVDDDEAIVGLAEERLASFGFEPTGFCDSREAWKAFQARPESYDLLISDCTMPALSGLDLAAAVRGLRPDLPIILITGNLAADIPVKAAEIGITEVLRKPLRARTMADSIARVIQGL